MRNLKKVYDAVIVVLSLPLICDGIPVTTLQNSGQGSDHVVNKDSHPMLASLFNVANNANVGVEESTGNSIVEPFRPVTSVKQVPEFPMPVNEKTQEVKTLPQNVNAGTLIEDKAGEKNLGVLQSESTKKPSDTNGHMHKPAVIDHSADMLCGLCRIQNDTECINKLCFNTETASLTTFAIDKSLTPSDVVPLAIPMGGFEQHLPGIGAPILLGPSSQRLHSIQFDSRKIDGVDLPSKVPKTDVQPELQRPEVVSLESIAQESHAQIQSVIDQGNHFEATAKVIALMGSTNDLVPNSTMLGTRNELVEIPRAHDMFATQLEVDSTAAISQTGDQQLEIQVQGLSSEQQGQNATGHVSAEFSVANDEQALTTTTAFPTIPPKRNAELQNFGKNFLTGLKSSLTSSA